MIMDNQTLYYNLASHLDQGIIGAPLAPSLIKILMLLYPGEEALVALKLPGNELTLEEAKGLFPDFADRIEALLERMADRGTVFTSKKPGRETKYRLFFQSLGGWLDTPFWSGRDEDLLREMGPLWLKYRREGLGDECARSDTPLMRVIPIETSFRDTSQVLSFDELKTMIEKQSFLAVSNCSCRLMTRYAGKGCDHSLETCLHFGSMARYLVDHAMARQITREEALAITVTADREGLIHLAENIDGYVGVVCNCCNCCCSFLSVAKELKVKTFAASNYVANVNEEKCQICGTCRDRCPLEVITIDTSNGVTMDENLCLGCGVCVSSCDAEARTLVRREKVQPPPSLDDFFQSRYKAPRP
jgi:electron transport complex protein RnfB